MVRDLVKHFPIQKGLVRKVVGYVRAVDGVSFTIQRGKVLGLVGESGCGKTTVGRSLLRLTPATSGSVEIAGRNVYGMKKRDLREARRNMQIVFQDPYSSLNPRLTVGEIVGEALMTHGMVKTQAQMSERVLELLERCGLSDYHIARYPHEFSGGQRQRICIARALALNPKFVVCDEAVSALDVSIQAQIINLLKDLQAQMDLTYLFISHDLSVVRYLSDDIAVMYLGKIVEIAPKEKLFSDARHPYSKALLAAVLTMDPEDRKERAPLADDMPSAANPPSGCRFHTRCLFAAEECSVKEPELREAAPGHCVACHMQS
ncbi:MAG: ABC transporter ATP-binding protein [Clostridia bacterium]|nr:ABC transporter ATP-binding protein [Clostridia bacterium]